MTTDNQEGYSVMALTPLERLALTYTKPLLARICHTLTAPHAAIIKKLALLSSQNWTYSRHPGFFVMTQKPAYSTGKLIVGGPGLARLPVQSLPAKDILRLLLAGFSTKPIGLLGSSVRAIGPPISSTTSMVMGPITASQTYAMSTTTQTSPTGKTPLAAGWSGFIGTAVRVNGAHRLIPTPIWGHTENGGMRCAPEKLRKISTDITKRPIRDKSVRFCRGRPIRKRDTEALAHEWGPDSRVRASP